MRFKHTHARKKWYREPYGVDLIYKQGVPVAECKSFEQIMCKHGRLGRFEYKRNQYSQLGKARIVWERGIVQASMWASA